MMPKTLRRMAVVEAGAVVCHLWRVQTLMIVETDQWVHVGLEAARMSSVSAASVFLVLVLGARRVCNA